MRKKLIIVVCVVVTLIAFMMYFENNKQLPEERKKTNQEMTEQQILSKNTDIQSGEDGLFITQKSVDGVDLLYEPVAYEILSRKDLAVSDIYTDKYIKDKSILSDKDEHNHMFLFVTFRITNRNTKPYYGAMFLYSFTGDTQTGNYAYSDMLCYFDGTDLSLDAEEREHHFFWLNLESNETVEYTIGFDIPKYDFLGKNVEYYIGIPVGLEKEGEDIQYETNVVAVKDIPKKTNN